MRALRLWLSLGLLAAPLWAAPPQLVPSGDFVTTKLPFTYVLDYNDGDYFRGDYEQYYREGPPGLLHMGTVTPCHSYFGPAHDAQASLGKRPFPPIETFVAEYRQRMAEAQRVNDQLRQQGVGQVIAYVCMMTIGGDPDKRTGFWHFYDNWAAFAPVGAGPKPATDPVQWQQRKPDGSEQHFYAKEHYMPMGYRYANCVNNPDWQTYMRWVIRGAAEARFDGVFVDNSNCQRCYCQYCREGFAKYLRTRYTPAELKSLFNDDLSLSTDMKGLRGAETQAYWAESVHDFQALLKAEGSKVRGHFYVFPNGLQGRPLHLETMFRDCDLGMYENSVGTYGTNPGRVRSHVIAGIYVSAVNDNLYAHKISACAGAPCRSGLLTRPGYPKSDPAWRMNEPSAELGLAEAAAFSGGGCFLHDPPKGNPEQTAARVKYNPFLASHKTWYEGYWPYASVGVLTLLGQVWRGDNQHATAAQSLVETLLAGQVLADPVVDRELSTDLSRYRTLLVPPLRNLPEAWRAKLTAYAKTGGKLLLSARPDSFLLDELDRPRDAAAVAALRQLGGVLPDDPAALLEPGGALAGLTLTDPLHAEHLRAAAYVDQPTKPKRLVLHLVNYDVMLGVKGGQVGSLTALPLRLSLPVGRRVSKLTLATPGAADQALTWKQTGDRVTFTVPRLDLYGVCRMELEGRP